jgi:hypothetical protein
LIAVSLIEADTTLGQSVDARRFGHRIAVATEPRLKVIDANEQYIWGFDNGRQVQRFGSEGR